MLEHKQTRWGHKGHVSEADFRKVVDICIFHAWHASMPCNSNYLYSLSSYRVCPRIRYTEKRQNRDCYEQQVESIAPDWFDIVPMPLDRLVPRPDDSTSFSPIEHAPGGRHR